MKLEFSKGIPVPDALMARSRLIEVQRTGVARLLQSLVQLGAANDQMEREWWQSVFTHFGIETNKFSHGLSYIDGIITGPDIEVPDRDPCP